MYKVVLLAIAISVVDCQYGGYHKPAEYKEEAHDYYAEPHYSYEYYVHDPKTGDIHSQKEERKGESTLGEYSLVEADGSKRTVHYSVHGKSGFSAQIGQGESGYKTSGAPKLYQAYEGSSSHQSGSYKPSLPSYEPAYKPALVTYQPIYRPGFPKYETVYKPAIPKYEPVYKPAPPKYEPVYKPAPPKYEPTYKPAPPKYEASYKPAPASYQPAYGHGTATSSVSFSTHGAHVLTSTKHIVPPKQHY